MNDMYTIIGYGLLFSLGFIWPLSKLPEDIKIKLNGISFILDVAVGCIMTYIFIGTASGMVIATVATVAFTAYMSWSTGYRGAQRLTLRGWRYVD